MAAPPPISVSREPFSCTPFAFSSTSSVDLKRASSSRASSTVLSSLQIFGQRMKSERNEQTQLRLVAGFNSGSILKASRDPPGLTEELTNAKPQTVTEAGNGCDLFDDLKHRFLSFKKKKYMENLEHFQNLSKGQAPKFMVIACADSRVCPSNILGFQPGEAFVIRNVANLVPPFESGPSETNAALEFAVNSLKVENILVIGHSCCGGIRALMSMQDDIDSRGFIGNWVVVGRNAKKKTEAAVSSLSFDHKCRHCEKESVHNSLSNLLTYTWIEEKVAKGELLLHGGYYDFIDCTFEKWTLDCTRSDRQNGKFAVKDKHFWC